MLLLSSEKKRGVAVRQSWIFRNLMGTSYGIKLPVCWAENEDGDFNAQAGYLNMFHPKFLEFVSLAVTTTERGTPSPAIITFETGFPRVQYGNAQDSMQLAIQFHP